MTDYGKDDHFRPFSNDTEYLMWLDCNCARGERGCRNYKPTATSSRHGCPIEVAVARASGDDGTILASIALRGGWLQPGQGGRLTDDHLWVETPEGHTAYATPQCPEFRGYDEPDDRPRRGPRQPASQLDLLDPRLTPSATPSAAPAA